MNPNAFTSPAEEDYGSDLGKAVAIWRSGRYIPITLAARLMAEGYDVGALEERHFDAR